MTPISGPERLGAGPFASASDYAECRLLHRKHGTSYFFASRLLSPTLRTRTDALYGFVRTPDEWVDNGYPDAPERLREYRQELESGLAGVKPSFAVLRAFCDVMGECAIPQEEPFLFLDAMEQDLMVARYRTYEELRGYMRGSASSVGIMMSYILCDDVDPACLPFAEALGEAMQMTNFLRDVGEDLERGRVYLPLEDLERFGLEEGFLAGREVNAGFRSLMMFEIQRTRELYRYAEGGLGFLPASGRRAVRLASALYGSILSRIEACEFDVFHTRARTSKIEKVTVAARVLVGISAFR